MVSNARHLKVSFSRPEYGQYVEVTDEVYMAYTQGDRKMRYFENDLKTERFVLGKEGQVERVIPSREDSLDRLMDENAQQFPHEESVENTVLHKLEVDKLHTALAMLTPEEQALIQALFFEEKTERQYAEELGVYFRTNFTDKISTKVKTTSINDS
ncbi:MAG: sigma-70 family RNA polymerase sigma factor [Gemmiger sp.]|uniref:sigma-70 family RNA polymerase sigma factor n=1 Tax=Gemmiger sp. TaxID=2049027 RepID=UPI002E7A4447|nr:sigma-70 family RNA polymerase sigma factor [Gemmiger sp.]MEE0709760.1 sigma-70 family RNA polymerase sigma factor [Gemmiger sp.]